MENNVPWLTSFSNRQLELILLMTEQCNFRCLYCYEDFKLGKISADVIEGVKNLIIKRIDNIEILNLSFFGGEPLMNKDAVIKLSEWALNAACNYGVRYNASITTNGYSLDQRTFDNLIKVGITDYQITLDGEKELHDQLRPTINGKPTFEKIYANILGMAGTSHDFHCTIRFNIADSNVDSVKSFISDYSNAFADERFTFHFHPIFGMKDLKFTMNDMLDELISLAKEKGFEYATPQDDALCYAARADSYVIRADGRVQKCTVALENDLNNIGRLDVTGNLNIDKEKLKKWVFANNKGCPLQSLSLEKLAVPYENAGKFLSEPAAIA